MVNDTTEQAIWDNNSANATDTTVLIIPKKTTITTTKQASHALYHEIIEAYQTWQHDETKVSKYDHAVYEFNKVREPRVHNYQKIHYVPPPELTQEVPLFMLETLGSVISREKLLIE